MGLSQSERYPPSNYNTPTLRSCQPPKIIGARKTAQERKGGTNRGRREGDRGQQGGESGGGGREAQMDERRVRGEGVGDKKRGGLTEDEGKTWWQREEDEGARRGEGRGRKMREGLFVIFIIMLEKKVLNHQFS